MTDRLSLKLARLSAWQQTQKRAAHERSLAGRLGARLRHARQYRGMTQKVVADALNVSKQSIGRMEYGTRQVLALELAEFSVLYDRPLEWFFWEGEPF